MKGIGPVFGGSDKELCYPVLHLFMKQAMSYFDQGYTKANLSFQKNIATQDLSAKSTPLNLHFTRVPIAAILCT